MQKWPLHNSSVLFVDEFWLTGMIVYHHFDLFYQLKTSFGEE